jgi:hypothetical protein
MKWREYKFLLLFTYYFDRLLDFLLSQTHFYGEKKVVERFGFRTQFIIEWTPTHFLS